MNKISSQPQQELPVSLIPSARMRSEGYWVCLSVTLNLTSRVFVRLTKDTTYLTGNEGQKIVRFSLKLLRCKARALPPLYG